MPGPPVPAPSYTNPGSPPLPRGPARPGAPTSAQGNIFIGDILGGTIPVMEVANLGSPLPTRSSA